MPEESSAKASAENTHVTPARTNDRMIDGPAVGIALPMITKMPVPMMAPRPSAVRSRAPTARVSSVSFSCVSLTRTSIGLVANRPLRPSLRGAVATVLSFYDGVMTRTGRRARLISSTGTLPSTRRATRPFVEAPQTITSASFSSA